ncbi:Stabilin-2 [Bagarius yarrelli]|uniref:Stabilin-2 n=1 Tax=Bagarius yarrelli TaxID=175774 RepID=A0A556THI4_BAGYA|nr:Stabilin-2 [Bagarius yarrelli]
MNSVYGRGMFLLLIFVGTELQSTFAQNRCNKNTQVMTKSECHLCAVSDLKNCPAGYSKKTPGKGQQNCRYQLKTSFSSALYLRGCSHECFKEVIEERCCSGYWGYDCLELPGCAVLHCGPDARCFEDMNAGKLVCKCQPGYFGDGVQCTSINPCQKRVCHEHAVCTHTGPNQHTCTCTEGYQGDGLVCLPIDPCQTDYGGCQSNSSRCVYDGPGKAHCECLEGFEKLVVGAGCSLRDVCKPDSCHLQAYCITVAPNTVECKCKDGFLGNGNICFGNIIQRLQELNADPKSRSYGQLSSAISLFEGVMSWPLTSLGPFTVFVPKNKAFKSTQPVKSLLADQAKARYLVKMHMIPGEVNYDMLKNGILYYTLTGKSAESITESGQVKVRIHGSRKKAALLETDIISSNGMIHITDKLLDSVPSTVISDSQENLMKILSDNGKFSIFKSLIEGKPKLLEFLRNHVVSSAQMKASYIVSISQIVSMANQVLTINVTAAGQILIGGVAVAEADVEAKNGCLYSLLDVLIPSSIEPILPQRCDLTESNIYKCLDGIEGNGTCQCEPKFSGWRCQYCSDPNKYGPFCNQTCRCVRGICDNRPESNGACKPQSCQEGITGELCNKHALPCGPNQICHIHANCILEQAGEQTCVCKPGYMGDGFQCTHEDPCTWSPNGGCSDNARCVQLGKGRHKCECLTGWKEDGDECQPVNNCLEPSRGGCHPNATCVFLGPGQASCVMMYPGKFECVCPADYIGDGRICYGTLEQELESNLDLSGFNTWVTKADLRQMMHEKENITLFVPSLSAIMTMSKDDQHFWLSSSNIQSLVMGHVVPGHYRLSDLRSSTSPQLVSFLRGMLPVSWTNETTTIGGATVTLGDIVTKNGLIHLIDKASVLIPDRKLSTGLIGVLDKTPEFSLFKNALIDLNVTQYHIVLDETLKQSDLQDGLYKDTMLGFSYQLGIFLNNSNWFVNKAWMNATDIETDNGVIHGLSAVLKIPKNRCYTASSTVFLGKCMDCFHPSESRCPAGTKQVKVSLKRCMFSVRKFGRFIGCEASCEKLTITKKCCEGFYGTECEPCPGPEGQSCFGNGVCMDGINGTGVCQCNPGFNGTACENCQPGKYGIHCDQDCKCVNGRCNDGLEGDGSCQCDVGWRGIYCSIVMNACAKNNGGCSPNAVCKRTLPGRRQCLCNPGYSGDGQKNGGCYVFAKCTMTGPGERNCTCPADQIGDGIKCKSKLMPEIRKKGLTNFAVALQRADIYHLQSQGPFTVFAPNNNAFHKLGNQETVDKDKNAAILLYHIVPCRLLRPEELQQPRNLTTLTGEILTISYSEGTIQINNNAKVVYSDEESRNGIFYEIDTVLIPNSFYKMEETSKKNTSLKDVVDLYGFKTFYKLLEDTEVIKQIQEPLHQPVTLFMPTDTTMEALPQAQKDFLYGLHNRAQLVEYLGYHIIQSKKGSIYVNDKSCRIIKRNLNFNEGLVYGIDCLLIPPSLGGRCDKKDTVDITTTQPCYLARHSLYVNSGCQSVCSMIVWKPRCCPGYYGRDCLSCPGGPGAPCSNHGQCDEGLLGNGTCTCNAGFQGVACELCTDGHFGPECKECNCTEHGTCNEGREGTGSCFCDEGWAGLQSDGPVCLPACHKKAVCTENNTCVCKPFYEGDGITCKVTDMCKFWNGGCSKNAKCTQKGEKVNCTCLIDFSGDGYVCSPVDPCIGENNGGCDEHALCTMTGPGKRKCECKTNYVGDGLTCELKVLPVNRCMLDNGQCHFDAQCTDLHYEDKTVGVFHYRSPLGAYKLNYTSAQEACKMAGGTIATYTQLSYAQQAGYTMCSAGWLAQNRVAYPMSYSNPNCGFGHVGIVDYGTQTDLSRTWDTFCYQVKDVKCECKIGYIGDGYSCTGNILQVLTTKPDFSNFLSQIMNYSSAAAKGQEFIRRLSNITTKSTLFVPDNNGLYENQTLSFRDLEHHLLDGRALVLQDLINISHVKSHLGNTLNVKPVPSLQNPQTETSSGYVNDRYIIESDILASNGVIHVLQGPLKAPPPPPSTLPPAHTAGLGIGVILLVILIVTAGFVAYYFYNRQTKPFQFHYFREDEKDENSSPDSTLYISNPMYESSVAPGTTDLPVQDKDDKHQVVDGGSYDLFQNS